MGFCSCRGAGFTSDFSNKGEGKPSKKSKKQVELESLEMIPNKPGQRRPLQKGDGPGQVKAQKSTDENRLEVDGGRRCPGVWKTSRRCLTTPRMIPISMWST